MEGVLAVCVNGQTFPVRFNVDDKDNLINFNIMMQQPPATVIDDNFNQRLSTSFGADFFPSYTMVSVMIRVDNMLYQHEYGYQQSRTLDIKSNTLHQGRTTETEDADQIFLETLREHTVLSSYVEW